MKHIILIMSLAFLSLNAFAQKNVKRPDSYNYNRAVELANEDKTEEAIDYFLRELKDNPKNGYAFAWLSGLYLSKAELGKALEAANQAVKLVPKKDDVFVPYSYNMRGKIYLALADTIKAFDDINSGLKLFPENEDLLEERAQLYYEQEKYDLSNKDYEKIAAVNPTGVLGYMGIGRNLLEQNSYDDAIAKFEKVQQLEPEYSSAYSFRAEAYIKKKMYDKAADDIIKALEIDKDDKAFHLLGIMADSAYTVMSIKLNVKSKKDVGVAYWCYCLGLVHEQANKYAKAIEAYGKAFELDAHPAITYRMSVCAEENNDLQLAMHYIDLSLDMDSTSVGYLYHKADLLYDTGKPQEAIDLYSKCIDASPEVGGFYYRRGFMKDNTRDIDGAIEDYTSSIVLSPDYAYAYLGRADMCLLKGEKENAMADYKKVVEQDTVPTINSCAMYAWLALGDTVKAKDFMNDVLQKYNENAGCYYDAACLHARMGELDKSLEYLEIAFQKGYTRIAHVMNDDDLDAIKDTEVFKALIEKYSPEKEVSLGEEVEVEEETAIVPFLKDGNTCTVNCTINGLPLNFCFDTGASDVSISNVEATFMLKNGYLDKNDFRGNQKYMDANGDVNEGTVINLRKVNFGGLELKNIRASVVRNQKAPLLLGQTVLERLGKIEIDNTRKELKITYKRKKE